MLPKHSLTTDALFLPFNVANLYRLKHAYRKYLDSRRYQCQKISMVFHLLLISPFHIFLFGNTINLPAYSKKWSSWNSSHDRLGIWVEYKVEQFINAIQVTFTRQQRNTIATRRRILPPVVIRRNCRTSTSCYMWKDSGNQIRLCGWLS